MNGVRIWIKHAGNHGQPDVKGRAMAYTLVAEVMSQAWSGEVARETFATIDEAEKRMARWARFGVDDYCTDPDAIRILDDQDREISHWSWRQKQPVAAPPTGPGA